MDSLKGVGAELAESTLAIRHPSERILQMTYLTCPHRLCQCFS